MFPTNEAETIALYKLIQNRVGWRIIELRTAFPDAVIQNGIGAQLAVEFEYVSKNFKKHKHAADKCDLIICWENNWENPAVPVWSLEDCAKEEAKVVAKLLTGWIPSDNLIHAHSMIEQLKARLDAVQPNVVLWAEEEFEIWLGENRYYDIMYTLAEREIECRHGLEKGALDKPPFVAANIWERLKGFLLDAKDFFAALIK